MHTLALAYTFVTAYLIGTYVAREMTSPSNYPPRIHAKAIAILLVWPIGIPVLWCCWKMRRAANNGVNNGH